MPKNYVLDTNVILHDCQSIFKFEDNNVVIPITVIEELDHFKKEMNELGRNARHFSKAIDELRKYGTLHEGIAIGNGTITVAFSPAETTLPPEMDLKIADNRILATALDLQLRSPHPTIIVTKDTNMRVKADALGIAAETYENDNVDTTELYTGYTEYVDAIHPNEYVVRDDGKYIKRYDSEQGMLVPMRDNMEAWGLYPINNEQKMAMDLLLNDDIKLVTLSGKAGTGKTLISIAAALQKVTEEFVYKKVLISRPVMPMGKDIGYLPGDIEEKLAPYMQPIFDNVEFLMTGQVSNKLKAPKSTKKLTKKEREAQELREEKEIAMFSRCHQELVAAGIMEIEPLTYIRGRSIPNVVMIIDECQNLTPHEVKTIVTRAGKNTKLIFTGDPNQIDNPYLDASSNGLTYLVEKMKDQPLAGHVTLTQGERSELAEVAANIL